MATPTVERPGVTGCAVRSKWTTVRVETDGATYVGRLYVPETKERLSDVLGDDRPFVSLTEVSMDDSERVEAFLAINKQFIKTVRVLHEGEADVTAIRSR